MKVSLGKVKKNGLFSDIDTGWVKTKATLEFVKRNPYLDMQFGCWKLVLVGKNTYLTSFIVWSKFQKCTEIWENCNYWKNKSYKDGPF